MKSSKQNGADRDKKSGQEVAKQNFGKTDARYWHDVIFKPIYPTKPANCSQVHSTADEI